MFNKSPTKILYMVLEKIWLGHSPSMKTWGSLGLYVSNTSQYKDGRNLRWNNDSCRLAHCMFIQIIQPLPKKIVLIIGVTVNENFFWNWQSQDFFSSSSISLIFYDDRNDPHIPQWGIAQLEQTRRSKGLYS